jgi:hypothetical protein
MNALRRNARRLLTAVVAFSFGTVPLLRAADPPPVHKFNVNLAVDLKGTGTQELHFTADAQWAYTFEVRGNEVMVSCDSVTAAARQNGKELMDMQMDRKRFVNKKDGKVVREVSVADAPPQLKEMLQDSFETPLATIQVDRNGKELKRTITAKPGAKVMIEGGMITNARMFHPPFYEDMDRWQAPGEVDTGDNKNARGDLTYTKVRPGDRGDQVRVKVSGTLTNKEVTDANGIVFKNLKYETEGEQIYDRKKKEWVGGTLKFKVTWDVERDGRKLGQTTGTMEATMKYVGGDPK